MATEWYQKSINALQLNGKGERTQEAYTRAVRMLCEFYSKRPEEISEQELEAYFLHRRNVDHWSANTMRICYCGIRFFFVHVLQHNWHLFDILRAKSEARLPAVLSREEVRALLGCVRTPHNYAFLATVYACGLRLQHVLPAGFMKVRHYGFLSPSCSMPIEEVKARIEMARGFVAHAPEVNRKTPAPKCCRHCGGRLRYQRMILPPRVSLIEAMAQAAAAVAETRRPMMRSAPASG
jgi:Phage integrase, N-terminal SAM-like domain/Putative transposase